jgi:hypothetical protein
MQRQGMSCPLGTNFNTVISNSALKPAAKTPCVMVASPKGNKRTQRGREPIYCLHSFDRQQIAPALMTFVLLRS